MQHEIDPEAKRSCNDKKIKDPMDAVDPSSKGGSAVINKVMKTEVALDEGAGLPSEAVPEEEDASRNTEMKKKETKRKRSKLQKINKEEHLSGAEKTEVPLDAKEPWR